MDIIARWIEILNKFDISLFLMLNNLHTPFFDWLMYWFSNKWIWFPVYLLVLIYIFKKKENYKSILVCIGLIVASADMTSSLVLKPLVQRKRPCYQTELVPKMIIVGSCGGLYGFVSSHAANSFAIATFLVLLFAGQKIWLFAYFWALLVAYSRIYLGVHFPFDVLVGSLIGIFYAILIYKCVLPKLKF